MKSQVKLKSATINGGATILKFNVAHNNGVTTVEQDMTLTSIDGTWAAKIELEEFPDQLTAKDAAHKLGDWLVRLGTSIKEESNRFESIIF